MNKVKLMISLMFGLLLVVIASGTALATDVPQKEPNANHTGQTTDVNGLNKARDGQAVHGSYQNNTNSCASCHKTHTGQDSEGYLLFADTSTDACEACHDGTVAPAIEHSTNAGVFAGQDSATGASQHNVDAGVKIASAPGGNNAAVDGDFWKEELQCSSCHNVHGSDSEFLLNTAQGDTVNNTINSQIYDSAALPAYTAGQEYILAWTPVTTTKAPWSTGYYNDLLSTGYTDPSGVLVPSTKVDTNKKVLMTYWWDGKDQKYVLDYPLWDIQDPATTTAEFKKPTKANHVIDYKHGLAYGTDIEAALPVGTQVVLNLGISVQPYRAEMNTGTSTQTVTYNRSYFDSAYSEYNAGSGRQLSLFCSQCHTDYMSYTRLSQLKGPDGIKDTADDGTSSPGTTDTAEGSGEYDKAHRHRTYQDGYSCTRCHFAHGTDSSIMRDAAGYKAYATPGTPADDLVLTNVVNPADPEGDKYTQQEALAYMQDPNDSSATKRYTGMTACYSCHGAAIQSDTETKENVAAQNGFKTGAKLPNDVPF